MCGALPGQLILRYTGKQLSKPGKANQQGALLHCLCFNSSLHPPALHFHPTSTHGRIQTGSFPPSLVLVIGFYYSNRNLTDTASTGLNNMIKWLTDLKGTLHLWRFICFKGYYNGLSENTDTRDVRDKEGEGCWNFCAFSSQISIFKIPHPSIWTQDIVLLGSYGGSIW